MRSRPGVATAVKTKNPCEVPVINHSFILKVDCMSPTGLTNRVSWFSSGGSGLIFAGR